jgi:RNA 2',3'-cyclic 3'-phosphodiesterase
VRLFTAVEIDDRMRRVAADTAESLRKRLKGALDARWTDVENLHFTVRFIGNVADANVPAIVERLAAPIDVAPFEIRLGACGAFPPSGPPRVIWIGVVEGLAPLSALHDECDRRLEPFGFTPEARAFSAHLTLARVREVRKGSNAVIRETLRAVAVSDAHCHVERLTIFRSHLSPRGSRYEALAHAPLVVR